ncbi:hypothetical protein SEUCBS140593_010410 [Sporothrix eucalyptigena]|uniref:Cupin type-1 domain-containing protein n=1 Tax=Sporothrix eucalyptigena TaxID=1812306 RepID=A0ABP0D429_9PEZI
MPACGTTSLLVSESSASASASALSAGQTSSMASQVTVSSGAVPAQSSSVPSRPSSSAGNATASTDTASVQTPAATGLSLTQQLLLAATARDRFALLPDDDQFIFDFNQPQAAAGQGGELIVANRKTFPALVGTGSGAAVGFVKPCGINTFHVHPRSAELQVVVAGRLVTEMVPENGVLDSNGSRRVIQTEIGPYQMTTFYQGSLHTQFNPDCTNTTFVSFFASEDFGTGQVLDETFAFTEDVIAAAFGGAIAGEDIDMVRQAIPVSIALGVEQCLQQCGIQKRSR